MSRAVGVVAFGPARTHPLHLEMIAGWTVCGQSSEKAHDVTQPDAYRVCERCRRKNGAALARAKRQAGEAASLDRWVREMVDRAPPLTPLRARRLAAVLGRA